MTFSVEFLPHNVKIEVDNNESLIRAAMDAGVHINASCGGGGVCGKCRVMVEKGQVEGGISEHLSAEDQEKGYRLACLSEVTSDLVIRVPVDVKELRQGAFDGCLVEAQGNEAALLV